MGSKNNIDVIASIKLVSFFSRYKLQNYERPLQKMIGLIWHSEKAVKNEVLKQYSKMFIKKLR
jgi:hypothetical protein